jgi:arylsulfatase A-like enzyme
MINLADLLPTCIEAAGGAAPKDLDGQSFAPVLLGQKDKHREYVFGTHTGNENGGPGTANHCPARTIRTMTHRYIRNLDPETTFTTHITGQKSGPHYLPHWDSWVERAKLDETAKKIVHAYQQRPSEELYDLENDPHEMETLAARPEYGPLLEDLRQKLSEWRRSQNDLEEDYQ